MTFKIGNYTLDEQQTTVVLDSNPHLLVVAGAGSGKTLTILGKIYYLINEQGVKPEEIICISFTKASSLSLKEKIKKEFNIDMGVYTFHKLALEVLKDYNYEIASDDLLNDIIYKFLKEDIIKNKKLFKKLLNYFNLRNLKDYQKLWKYDYAKVASLMNLISTFIHLFKCNNKSLKDFLSFKKQIRKISNFNYFKEKTLLLLILNVYLTYQRYLEENKEIDFDDMLSLATKEVEEKGFRGSIKYLIIDEYQDTSLVRFNFVRAILAKTKVSLMVVGDDFQSIYRFTGCELGLFLDFKEYFPDAKVMKIENTYRNSQELINVAGNFVMKNPAQMRKTLKSKKRINKPIEIIFYKNSIKALKELILKIKKETNHSIMILGRNNNDIKKYIDKDFKLDKEKLCFKDLELTYLTVHRSKGLECDEVIVLNLTDDILGFPSKLMDDKILRLVSLNKNTYAYDEERRLFYVALTRTKNKVYLLVDKKMPSMFVKELLKDYANEINVSYIY